jgi:hypothetical protein
MKGLAPRSGEIWLVNFNRSQRNIGRRLLDESILESDSSGAEDFEKGIAHVEII